MEIIVGLGNPGGHYDQTRHNAGFWFVDAFAGAAGKFRPETRFHGELCKWESDGWSGWLLKPTTFMNRSGQAVAALAGYYKIPPGRILVAHDELDLPPGTVRLKQGGGHGGHNGLRSLIEHLGTADFMRLRIGIGHPGDRDKVVDYVLERAGKTDREAIDASLHAALAAMPHVLAGDVQRAMQKLHSK